MFACRTILETVPGGGAWNMAVDETLLESAANAGTCTVRWYTWAEATLSLGYFQPEAGATGDPRLSGLPRVRRLSGGGAILHHHELTYSCAVPRTHPLANSPHDMYLAVHSRIISVLAAQGIDCALRGAPRTVAGAEEFLCFRRGHELDVVLDGHKVLGSAQRRRRGAVLQHGSLVLRRSEYAPEFPGLFDLAPGGGAGQKDLTAETLWGPLAAAVGEVFGPAAEAASLGAQEREDARVLMELRYAQGDWIGRR